MKFRQTLFWDTNPAKLDIHRNAQYIVERVADFGNDQEARWVLDFYDKSFLQNIILSSNNYSYQDILSSVVWCLGILLLVYD